MSIRVVLAAVDVVCAATVSACGGHADPPRGAAVDAATASRTATPVESSMPPSLSSLPAARIAAKGRHGLMNARSVTLDYRSRERGVLTTAKVSVDKKGNCVARVSFADAGTVRVIRTHAELFVRLDERAFRRFIGRARAKELAKMYYAVGDDPKGRFFAKLCSLRYYTRGVLDPPGATYRKHGFSLMGGAEEIVLDVRTRYGTGRWWVTVAGTPYLMMVIMGGGRNEVSLEYGGLDQAVPAHRPPARLIAR